MKKAAVIYLLVAGLLPLSSWAADKEKIVYVDLQKVFLTSEPGKQAKKALDKEAEEKKAALEEKKKEFQKMKDELQKKMNILSEESRNEKLEALENKRQELLQYVQESDMKLAERDRDLTKKITQDIQGILKTIAEKEGYTLILEKGSTLYAPDDMDITDEVIKQYNKKSKK